jgi:predicted GNAT family acetyltransferase
VKALEVLVDAADDMALVGPHMPKLGSHWETIHASELTQMVREDRAPLAEAAVGVVALGPRDVEEMLALVDCTQPGPFRARTIDLGHFIGVREGGALAAMAGERTWIGDWREVSGVCTHPRAQGRGYARALIAARRTG